MAAVVVAVLLLTKDTSDGERSDAALELSREFAVALTSHDHRDLDASFDTVRRLSVGSFLEDFETRVASPEARAALEEAESRVTSSIELGPLLAAFEGDRARTFTVVRQRGTADGEEVEQVVRVELLLVDTDEGWRVDAVEVT